MIRRFILATVLALVALSCSASAQAAPILEIIPHHGPTVFQPGGIGEYTFLIRNHGDAPTGAPVTLTIDLPEGVTTRQGANNSATPEGSAVGAIGDWHCPTNNVEGESSLTCTHILRYSEFDTPEGFPSGVLTGGSVPSMLSVYVAIAPDVTGPLVAKATLEADGTTSTASVAAPVGAPVEAFGVDPSSWFADVFDRWGAKDRQAGAHPARAVAAFDVNRNTGAVFNPSDGTRIAVKPVGTLRNVDIVLPRGFVGDTNAVAKCPAALFLQGGGTLTNCPPSSQVGIVDFAIVAAWGPSFLPTSSRASVHSLPAPKGSLAAFGFQISGNPVYVLASLDPRDNSVVTRVKNVNEIFPLHYQRLTLWGDPGDPVHDLERWNPATDDWGAASTIERRPFLTLPSECGVADTTDMRANSWQQSATWTPWISSTPAQVKGCERLTFAPSIKVRPDATAPDAPTGLAVDIELPQDDNPAGLGTPPLRNVKAVLPEGMTINPAAADGLTACSDDRLRLGTDLGLRAGEPSCPDASKIGSVTAKSPALDDPIRGDVFVRSQNSDDPASGEMFRLAIVLEDEERGLIVKLPGSVRANPATGRLETEFDDNPQLPVSSISLRLDGGPRAPLATPPTCGTKTVEAKLSSWGGQSVELTDSFTIACPGAEGFAPAFEASTRRLAAGGFSPFVAEIDRKDRDQYLSGIKVDLPKGLLAKLKGVALCPAAVAGEGSPGVCPAGSRIGTASVGAGAGSPFYLPAPVYLTDGYKGAPYGLSVQVPAKAGPFDLGLVKVAAALHVDPIDAHVTVVADPLPQVVKGVPVRLRSVDVDIDRPEFTINPTSCAAKSVDGVFTSVANQTASLAVRFQVGDCASLALKPNLALSLSGKGQTTDGKHPAVTANVTQPAGQANLKKVRVALPLSLALDPDNANGLCEFVDGSKVTPTCPKSSIVGTATAVTPILDQPLTGPVYFVKNIRKDPKSGREIRTLPKLVIPLTGQNGLKLTLTGTSNVEKDHLVTTFDNIPDAPVSSFKLNINGGKGGILAVSGDKADICKSTQVADQQVDGHNGKQADADVSIQTPSCPLKVLSKKVGKRSLAIKVGGLGAGKVTVTGKGIKKTTKTISKSTVATITAKRTKGKPGKVTVSYDPTGPAKPRKTTK